MEKLIKLMTNKRTAEEQTNFMEEINEFLEFAGITLASIVILAAIAIFQ